MPKDDSLSFLLSLELVPQNFIITFVLMETKQQYDIAIIGAGPAGCSAALTLQNSRLKVALFEKNEFPRQKICGDGICDRSINTLRAINPQYLEEFLSTQTYQKIRNTRIVYKNKSYVVDFKNFGYACKRYEFDNFLFSLVKRDCQNMSIPQNTAVTSLQRDSDGFVFTAQNNALYHAKMVLICSGAASSLARSISRASFDRNKMGVAIRAYYRGVKDLQEETIELHYKKQYFPGYLWIFPLADGIANVGFGWHLGQPSQEKIQDAMYNWIQQDETLRQRFSDAQQISLLQGGLIPYNTTDFNCYGDNYCICGDSANLIDPISGGGIGSAMLSGHFAAQIAEKAIMTGDCSKNVTKEYAEMLRKRVQSEMKTRYSIQQKITNHTWLLDVLAFVGKQTKILNCIKKWYLE